MALNLPNFLGAQLPTNNWSGLSDIINNYQQSRAGSLANRSSELDIAQKQLAIQKQQRDQQLLARSLAAYNQAFEGDRQQRAYHNMMQGDRQSQQQQPGIDYFSNMLDGAQQRAYPNMTQGDQQSQQQLAQTLYEQGATEKLYPGSNVTQKQFGVTAAINEQLGNKAKSFITRNGEVVSIINDLISGQQLISVMPTGDRPEQQEYKKLLATEKATQEIAANRRNAVRNGKQVEIPSGAVDFYDANISEAERNQFRKDIREDIESARSGVKVLKKLHNIEEVLNKYPNLYKSLPVITNAALDKKDINPIIKTITKNISSKKELAAYEIFLKNSYDIVLDMAKDYPRATDSLRDQLVKSKAEPGYTDTANRKILQQMREQYSGHAGWLQALNDGSELGFYPAPDPQAYENYLPQRNLRESEKKTQANNRAQNLAKQYTLEELKQLEAIHNAANKRKGG